MDLFNHRFLQNHEDVRIAYAYKSGGRVPEKEILIKKLRTIGKEIILSLGKKILSGKFNLTTVSFPIKAMVPKSYLENVALASIIYKNLPNK